MRRPAAWLLTLSVLVVGGIAAWSLTLRGDGGSATPTTTSAASGEPAEGGPESDRAARTAFERVATATGPAEIAEVMAAAEAAIRDDDTPAAALATWAEAQQLGVRRVATNPAWDAAFFPVVGGRYGTQVRANVEAQRALFALTDPRPSLPDWLIVDPPPIEELRGHYDVAAREFGVGWEYLAAIHLVETRMGRIRGASTAGALGPMQFLPSTWEAYGEGDIHDPLDSIRAAGRYLVAHGAPDSMAEALFAYNRSDRYVEAIEAYARVMRDDERAFLGYYHWQVYYRLESGDVLLPVGWESGDPPREVG